MRPVKADERVIAIDTLRGAALAGVLLINLLSTFRIPLSSHILGNDQPLGWAGDSLLWLIATLVEFKSFTLFSLLFGVGVAIQAERAERTGISFLLRRFGALLIFGLLHLLLIWKAIF